VSEHKRTPRQQTLHPPQETRLQRRGWSGGLVAMSALLAATWLLIGLAKAGWFVAWPAALPLLVVVVGASLPQTVVLNNVPDYRYQYVYVNDTPVLVDPLTRRIVYVFRQ